MLNKAVIMGRLVRDPELKHTQKGKAYTSLCLAVERNYSRNGEQRQTDFIDCEAWKQTAEFICKYFRKGQMIGLEGSIQTRNYTDQDGNKRYATEVLAENVSFCESKKSESHSQPSPSAPAAAAPSPGYSSGSSEDFEEITPDDDMPF